MNNEFSVLFSKNLYSVVGISIIKDIIGRSMIEYFPYVCIYIAFMLAAYIKQR